MAGVVQAKSEYNKNYTYGLNQIDKEINIKIDTGRKDREGNPKMAFKYILLNSDIDILKKELNRFYDDYISKKLFKYELLK